MNESDEPRSSILVSLNHNKATLIDIEDLEKIQDITIWAFHSKKERWYAYYCNSNHRNVPLHRLILNTNKEIDHINGDGLDNRKSNLRIATPRQNLMNSRKQNKTNLSSRYKGVSLDKRMKIERWRARISNGDKDIFIGSFPTEIEAAKAYDNKARELFGEYAKLNFPEESK